MRPGTRTVAVLVALAAVLSAGGAPPAWAHICATPLEVLVGRPVTFTVGVPAEDAVVGRVEIEVPPAFDLHRAVEYPGWEVERDGNVVTYSGGRIDMAQCAHFTLAGEVSEETTLVVPFTTYSPEGEKLVEFAGESANHANAAQLVYAGTDAQRAEPDRPGRDDGPSALMISGVALVGAALLGGAGFVLIRRGRARAR